MSTESSKSNMDIDIFLTRRQLNEIGAAVDREGLEHTSFSLEVLPAQLVGYKPANRLVHRTTGYYFQFRFDAGATGSDVWTCTRYPGAKGPSSETTSGTWKSQLSSIRAWLKLIHIEVRTPDLWPTLLNARSAERLALPDPAADNSMLGSTEREALARQLTDMIGAIIATPELSHKHRALAESNFEYLDHAMDRLGRRDWAYAAAGVFFTVAAGIGMSPHDARALVALNTAVLRKLTRPVTSVT